MKLLLLLSCLPCRGCLCSLQGLTALQIAGKGGDQALVKTLLANKAESVKDKQVESLTAAALLPASLLHIFKLTDIAVKFLADSGKCSSIAAAASIPAAYTQIDKTSCAVPVLCCRVQTLAAAFLI